MADVEVLGPTSWNTLIRLDALPEPRPQTLFAQSATETVGGTSAGKTLHLHDRGRSVRLTTVVGDDDPGRRSVGALRAVGIDVEAAVVPGPGERHCNLMTGRGERVSIYLSTPDARMGDLPDLHDRMSCRALVVDLAAWTRELVEVGHTQRDLVWTDIHDYDGVTDFHRPFIAAASHVFLNADGLATPGDFMHSLADQGVTVVVCTLGGNGAWAVDSEHREWRVVALPVDRIVDTNGAGDGFFAGFLDATLDGADVAGALEAGAEQAARALVSSHLNPLLDDVLG